MRPKQPNAGRRKRALTDDELYLGPVSAKLAAIRRAREDADNYEADPRTPRVVLDRVGDAYTAYIDPPLPPRRPSCRRAR